MGIGDRVRRAFDRASDVVSDTAEAAWSAAGEAAETSKPYFTSHG